MQVEAAKVIEALKEQVSDLSYDKALLNAQLKTANEEIEVLKSKK